jgi:hypothetical protein
VYENPSKDTVAGESKMHLKIKTLWMGKAGVRGKYIDYCKSHKENLTIEHNKRCMMIPYFWLDNKAVGSTEKAVKELYGGQKDYLFYYKFEPDKEQQIEFKI